jgi:hypothetical protein
MRAELKSLFSIDADPLDGYAPVDPEHFGIFVQAFIGSTDSDAFDSFEAFVCSPSWFAEHFDDKQLSRSECEAPGVRFGNRFLFHEAVGLPGSKKDDQRPVRPSRRRRLGCARESDGATRSMGVRLPLRSVLGGDSKERPRLYSRSTANSGRTLSARWMSRSEGSQTTSSLRVGLSIPG